MLTLSWRRVGSSFGLTLALLAGLPALAQAQLFPNLFIQRQRNECAAEPPFYKQVRRDYFGYYPTCWRTFPEGWACPCPNPELPNRERSFREQPADPKPKLPPNDMDSDSAAPDPDMAPGGRSGADGRPGTDPTLPKLPGNSRSPFEIDSNPTPKRPAVPANPENDDPFLSPRATGSPRPNAGGSAAPIDRIGTPPRDGPNANGAPSLDAPLSPRPKGVSRRTPASSLETSNPVLALPEMAPMAVSPPADAPMLSDLPASLPTSGAFLEPPSAVASNPTPAPQPQPPVQAPRRTSLIGSLFGMGNRTQR